VVQDGIDAYYNEDVTVFVYNDLYYENVVVDKTINLIGEDRDNTIFHTELSVHLTIFYNLYCLDAL